MDKTSAYNLLRAAAERIIDRNDEIIHFEEIAEPTKQLQAYGVDIATFGEIIRDLEIRLKIPSLEMESMLVPERFNTLTIGDIIDHMLKAQKPHSLKQPIVVYVDDEEQNIFVFKRKFSKYFKLQTFTNPFEALAFIKETPEVGLVITDEVMPGMRGNELCTEVKKLVPSMAFILITGNPENDNNLLYRTLRQNRFFEFFQKPVDFDTRREEYLGIIRGILNI